MYSVHSSTKTSFPSVNVTGEIHVHETCGILSAARSMVCPLLIVQLSSTQKLYYCREWQRQQPKQYSPDTASFDFIFRLEFSYDVYLFLSLQVLSQPQKSLPSDHQRAQTVALPGRGRHLRVLLQQARTIYFTRL